MEGYSMNVLKFIFAALVIASLANVHAAAPKKQEPPQFCVSPTLAQLRADNRWPQAPEANPLLPLQHKCKQTNGQPIQGRKKKRPRTEQPAKTAEAIAISSASAPAAATLPAKEKTAVTDVADVKASAAATDVPKAEGKDPLNFLTLENINNDLEKIKFADGSYFKIEKNNAYINKNLNAYHLFRGRGLNNGYDRGGIVYTNIESLLPKSIKTSIDNPELFQSALWKQFPAGVPQVHHIKCFANIDISSRYQRMGLGSILALMILKQELDNGCSCMVANANEYAGPMLAKFGFKHDEKTDDRFEIWPGRYNYHTENLSELLKTHGRKVYDASLAKVRQLVSAPAPNE